MKVVEQGACQDAGMGGYLVEYAPVVDILPDDTEVGPKSELISKPHARPKQR